MSQANRPHCIFRSRRVLVPDGIRALDVVVADGRIVEIVEHGRGAAEELVDLGDDLLIPALVDVHVHVNEPGRTEWEGFATASRAAAAGGIGLLVDMPLNSEPVVTTVAALEAKLDAARRSSIVDVAAYAGVVPANARDARTLGDLALAGVAGFKAFLCDSGLDSFPPVDEGDLAAAMATLSTLGRRLLVHAERFEHPPSGATGRRYATYLASRPPTAELDAIAMTLRLARATDCPVHVVHLATAEALPLLAAAKADGVDVTVETCPHYLTFAAEEIADGDTVAKCAPPIRDAANREALWRGLGDGTIDFVATDHSPCPPAMKERESGDFGTAWGGIASLELLLPALWSGARQRGIPFERVLEWTALRPARWLGLADRGAIEVGARADLAAVRPEESFVVRGAALQHRHPLTPYEGRTLDGVVTGSWSGGAERFRGASDGIRRFAPTGGAVVRIRGGFPRAVERGFARFAARGDDELRRALSEACAARRWVEALLARRPWRSARELFAASERAFDLLAESDWLEAFAGHPRLGDRDALRRRHATAAATAATESSEQAGAAAASEATLRALADGNREYENRFGFVFLLCASGRTAEEMLSALRSRLVNERARELVLAAEEQRKIALLRLERRLRSEAEEGR